LWRQPSVFRNTNVETSETVKTNNRRAPIAIGAIVVALAVAFGVWALAASPRSLKTTPIAPAPPIAHAPLPVELRGVYITALTASSYDKYVALIASVKAKGVNAIVLDVKTEDGSLAFAPNDPALKQEAPVNDIILNPERLVKATHDAGLYLIARMPVFEDPAFAEKNPKLALRMADGSLWRNAKGLAWLDPAAEVAWKYNADIAREVYARGFDEVQLDYVRFATDGKTSKIVFPIYDSKKENMRGTIGRFFAYMDKELRGEGIPISVDMFGYTTWHQSDLGIGQWYADALSHFDFVSPMVYPSHYPAGTLGFKKAAEHPYEIVIDSLKKGNEVVAQLTADPSHPRVGTQRPWLQAFNLGAVYTPAMILSQVKAAREAGSVGFLFWNASNNYSSLPNLISNQ